MNYSKKKSNSFEVIFYKELDCNPPYSFYASSLEEAIKLADTKKFDADFPLRKIRITHRENDQSEPQHVLSGWRHPTWKDGQSMRIHWVAPVYEATARLMLEEALMLVNDEIAFHTDWNDKTSANYLIKSADRLAMCLPSLAFKSLVTETLATHSKGDNL